MAFFSSPQRMPRSSRTGMLRTTAIVAALVVTLLVAAPAVGTSPSAEAISGCAGSEWVGAWAAAPSNAGLAAEPTPGKALVDQTVRMVVRPTLAGGLARVRLTHRYGDAPAMIASATLARRDSGASALPGTMRRLTFRGSRSVALQPGAAVTSDPVRLAVRRGSDLLVSLHISGSVTRPTEHFITNQSNHRTPSGAGDHTTDTADDAFVLPTRTAFSDGWFFLAGLDVRVPRASSAVVAFGDSITDGFQGIDAPTSAPVENPDALDRNARYPDFLAARLAQAGRGVSVLNSGISGNKVLYGATTPLPFGPAALTRLHADAIALSGVRDVIILEGINDLGGDEQVTARQLIDGLATLTRRAKRAELRVHLGTLTPSGGASGIYEGYGTAHTESRRLAVNRWIRHQTLSQYVVDFDKAVRDPDQPARLRPSYDSGDHLHPNAAGYLAMAAAIPLRSLARSSC